MPLRNYQSDAVEAGKAWLKASVDPCVIEAPTGAGKSHIIAALADWLHGISGKRVLCLAPRKTLTKQNAAKMRDTGHPCSIFSASAGMKSTRHKIVFGTPLTVKNSISRFLKTGEDGYCAVVIDECHEITPTIKAIIEAMRVANPRLRVIGLSATPYRLGSGYIYSIEPNGAVLGEDVARDPYFKKCVYTIEARYLIDMGYLTPPEVGAINTSEYDTSGLVMKRNGMFDAASVDAAFVGHGRKTASIVADVVAQARDRKGVVFFAATIAHAQEVLASLPPSMSGVVHSKASVQDNDKVLAAFERGEIKYLVNVAVLTTGWDCAHVDVIAILRRTESVSLAQQIIGRGLRLNEGKTDCLVLDYAGNIDEHFPSGDIFAPRVKAGKGATDAAKMTAICPDCGYENEFTIHPDYADYEADEHGYCKDVFGDLLMSEYGPVAKHYGRRCMGELQTGPLGQHTRCEYYWTSKPCPQCNEPNDIAARQCRSCKAEIIDPNERLIADFKALKRDPYRVQTDRVVGMERKDLLSRAGSETTRVDFVTPHRQFSIWLMKQPEYPKQVAALRSFEQATEGGTTPATVTYIKDRDSDFYRVLAYNQPEDAEPEPKQKVTV